ncbi:stage III sporulation protein AE [Desulfonispora thiosulfatigenes DSM 11270]|uniref:Stage III sporulation protein AE n=1 Tax=Desulfonispora thiosulfatigenes DSM 11270 TaxID=656914 RepID=A0A1W1VNA8_DESTI|nr:stage III sporulation protein AE [Desulfonispora thiosulfatigenes]SMB94816.1 stage III sporulation protein AE [Desulfonispora thiosulfatigenes DSM 11270]
MKRVAIIILFLIFMNILTQGIALASEEKDIQEITENQLDLLDLTEVDRFTNHINEEISSFIPNFSVHQFIQDLKEGKVDLSFKDIINNTFKFLFKEIGVNLALMGKLIVLAVLCSVLSNLHNAFEKGTIAKLAYAVSFLVLITFMISSFQYTIEIGKDAVQNMVTFMQALMPILLTLLASLGAFTSTAILHPFIFITIASLSTLYKTVIFPLILLGAVLSIINNISSEFKITRLSSLLNQVIVFFLGLTFTLFIGVLSVQGVGGAIADGVSLRTAKYMTGAFIPVVGSMFSDVLEAVIGGSLLLKNAIGIMGLLIIVVISLFPAIKIFAIIIIYKVSSAIIQPLGNSQISDTLDSMAGSLLLVFASVATVALMFFLTIIIVVTTANITVMLR